MDVLVDWLVLEKKTILQLRKKTEDLLLQRRNCDY